ncbi:serine/threonine protein kinase [Stanieria sp. NIES-3757]|nr:serine/threonine protein kinase [Stanieria sp. NIES-3757]
MARSSALLRDGTILNDRYKIIREIGRGGFGRTYLAEDTQRYREKCVLKEFAPQVENERDLRKAEELFEREAGILYQLKHEQIPRFEALLRTKINGKESLFLVQEYIEGDSYWDLLQRTGKFSEVEVIQLLKELLPVLEYIHSENLIHRDISPDNLLFREKDDKPVLIDFGCVKVAANAVSKSTGQSITLIGKKGYAPEEQMRSGQAFPSSDLYSLAVTIVVLLTAKQPHDLYDMHQGVWRWQSEVKLSSHLSKILEKMLAYHPRDRYQSARQVIKALEANQISIVSNFVSKIRTLIVAPGNPETQTNPNRPLSKIASQVNTNISRLKTQALTVSRQITQPPPEVNKVSHFSKLGLLATGVIILPGILTFTLIKNLLSTPNGFHALTNSSLSKQESNLQKDIYERLQALQLDAGNFYGQVDQEFYRRYPQLKNVQLTEQLEHRQYRETWYQIANTLLKQQENKFNN